MAHSISATVEDAMHREAATANPSWQMRKLSTHRSLGYNAGDANLYRYVGNSPTSAVDPTGLWTWRLDATGRVLVASEAGDTLGGLVSLGYKADFVAALGKGQGVGDANAKMKAGIELDITGLMPAPARAVLARQQQMDFENMRSRVEATKGGPKNIPKGRTLGDSGIDWFQNQKYDEDLGVVVTEPYTDNRFGLGNCYGFVGMCLGQIPPKGVPPENFGLSALKDEGFGGEASDKPGKLEKDWKENGGLSVYVCPEGGLLKLLIGGGKPTDKPNFGDVVLFKNAQGIAHAGFVLGRTQADDVLIVQKINSAAPCGISSVKHPLLEEFGKPTFYRR